MVEDLSGKPLQINAKTGETMTVGDKTYALVQFHFHAPIPPTFADHIFPGGATGVYHYDGSLGPKHCQHGEKRS